MDHEKTGDYGRSFSDYQTTMPENPAEASDYKLCPLLAAGYISAPVRPDKPQDMERALKCHGPRCAWYDQTTERCAVLSLARNK